MAVKHTRVITDAEAASPTPEISKDQWNDSHTIENDTIATAHVQSGAITYAKIQNVSATDRILGRDSAGAGTVEEITPAALRTMINVADGANNYVHPNHTGDVTSVADGATTIANNAVTTAKINDGAVTDAKLRDSAAVSVIGRSANTAGPPADITAGGDGRFLGRRADVVDFYTLQASDLPSHNHAATDVNSGTLADARLSSNVPLKNAANTFTAGQKQTVSHDGTNAGLNIGPVAGDPSGSANGDVWYNGTTNKFRCKENGTNKDLDTGGAGADNLGNHTATQDLEMQTFNVDNAAAIRDTNNNEQIILASTASAVNEITVRNAATGAPAKIEASGEANASVLLKGKGTGTILIGDQTDDTKRVTFDASGATTATKTILAFAQSADRTITFPNVTDTLVGRTTSDTLTNKSINADANVITNIDDSDIKIGAAIDAAKIHDGSISNTEFGHLNGLSGNIQTQLDGKAATSHVHAAGDITSGTMATARLGSGTANSSTFLRGDQTYATPPTSSDGTSQIPASATLAAWQTAVDNAGPRGKVRGAKALDITIAVNSFLRISSDASGQIDNDGVHLDGQRCRFVAAAGAWTTINNADGNPVNRALIDIGVTGGNETIQITIEHFYISCARQKVNGIGNARDFSGAADSRLKFSRISDCVIENVGEDDGTTTGVYCGIEIFHTENVVVIEHCHIDGIQGWSASHHGVGIHVVDDDNNAGNCRVIFCLIGSPGGQNGTYGVWVHAAANVLNRIFVMWNHIFMGSANNSIAVYVQMQSGNLDGNRSIFIFGNSLEDVHIGIYADGTSGGVALCIIECNYFEMKGGFRSTGALLKVGPNAEVFVNMNSFYGRMSETTDILNTWVMESGCRICVFTHNLLFNRLATGSPDPDGTWNKLSGAGTANWRGRDNIGFVTEKNVVSADQAADGGSGPKELDINHGLDIQPNVEDCIPFFVDGTTPLTITPPNDDYRAQILRVVSTTTTQVKVRWHQTAADPIAGTKIRIGLQSRTRLPAAT